MTELSLSHFCPSMSPLTYIPVGNPSKQTHWLTKPAFGGISTIICHGFTIRDEQTCVAKSFDTQHQNRDSKTRLSLEPCWSCRYSSGDAERLAGLPEAPQGGEREHDFPQRCSNLLFSHVVMSLTCSPSLPGPSLAPAQFLPCPDPARPCNVYETLGPEKNPTQAGFLSSSSPYTSPDIQLHLEFQPRLPRLSLSICIVLLWRIVLLSWSLSSLVALTLCVQSPVVFPSRMKMKTRS